MDERDRRGPQPGVQDGTEAIAASFGAKIHRHPWQGFREQKNLALSYATLPWVLALDADEEVSEELRESISVFFRRRRNVLPAPICPQSLVPGPVDHARRLVSRPRFAAFSAGEGKMGRQRGTLRRRGARALHDPCRATCCTTTNPNISSYVNKINYFADLYLQRQLAEKAPLVRPGGGLSLGLAFCARLFYPPRISGWLSRLFHRRLHRLLDAGAAQPALRASATAPARMRPGPNLPDHLDLRETGRARPGACAACSVKPKCRAKS